MNWKKVDDYYMKSTDTHSTFYISKSKIYEKVIYELWNGNKWLYKSDNLSNCKQKAEKEYAKAQAIQHNKEQLTSIGAEAA